MSHIKPPLCFCLLIICFITSKAQYPSTLLSLSKNMSNNPGSSTFKIAKQSKKKSALLELNPISAGHIDTWHYFQPLTVSEKLQHHLHNYMRVYIDKYLLSESMRIAPCFSSLLFYKKHHNNEFFFAFNSFSFK